jgi:hypothetical protein
MKKTGHWEEWVLFGIVILAISGFVTVFAMAIEETFK